MTLEYAIPHRNHVQYRRLRVLALTSSLLANPMLLLSWAIYSHWLPGSDTHFERLLNTVGLINGVAAICLSFVAASLNGLRVLEASAVFLSFLYWPILVLLVLFSL